jgi:hypothetical protein
MNCVLVPENRSAPTSTALAQFRLSESQRSACRRNLRREQELHDRQTEENSQIIVALKLLVVPFKAPAYAAPLTGLTTFDGQVIAKHDTESPNALIWVNYTQSSRGGSGRS